MKIREKNDNENKEKKRGNSVNKEKKKNGYNINKVNNKNEGKKINKNNSAKTVKNLGKDKKGKIKNEPQNSALAGVGKPIKPIDWRSSRLNLAKRRAENAAITKAT